jgi:hypothetical protein
LNAICFSVIIIVLITVIIIIASHVSLNSSIPLSADNALFVASIFPRISNQRVFGIKGKWYGVKMGENGNEGLKDLHRCEKAQLARGAFRTFIFFSLLRTISLSLSLSLSLSIIVDTRFVN